MSVIVGFGVGLLVGWNVLPQPKWVASLWAKAVKKIKSLGSDTEV